MLKVQNKTRLFTKPAIPVDAVSDRKYTAKIVESVAEFELVLKLRRDVFREELGGDAKAELFSDMDEFDAKCLHLIVKDKDTGCAVGTYRLNSYENAGSVDGFYASVEFCLEELPEEILKRSVEIGRACIARDHRNSRVLFLLWRLLASYMESNNCRYLFGCCSVFTQDPETAADIFAKLRDDGNCDSLFAVSPRPERVILPSGYKGIGTNAEIPPLVNIYMRIGAKVCGEPAIDREFKTVDYFVVFDLEEINAKYKKMFFG